MNVIVIQNNQELNNISISKLQYLPYTDDVTEGSTEGSISYSNENILTDQFEGGALDQRIKKETLPTTAATTISAAAATTISAAIAAADDDVPSNMKALSSEDLRLQIEENMHKYIYTIYINIHIQLLS